MGDHDVVVGVCNDGIALFHVDFFEFFGCETAVGDGGMTVKVCFVKITGFGQEVFFHVNNPFCC